MKALFTGFHLILLTLVLTSTPVQAGEGLDINKRIENLEKQIQINRDLKNEIVHLKKRVKELEGDKATKPKSTQSQFPSYNRSRTPQNFPGAPSTPSAAQGAQPQFPAYNRARQSQSFQTSTATGFSRLFNPAISANGMYLGTYRSVENQNRQAETRTGFDIQEVELQATANVDNYLRANLVASFEETDEFEIEESYVDAVITRDFSIRVGKWFSNFGKHNFLHQHQFPFIDAPLVNLEVFGEESLNEIGAGINFLVPLPWYSELIFDVLEGDNPELLDGPRNTDFAYLLHAKNLWDLNDDTTLEAGGSFVYGKNGTGTRNNSSYAAGGNLTLKWIPSQRARYNQIEWQAEYIHAERNTGTNSTVDSENPVEKKAGLYSYLKYQFAQNWWVQGRYDFFGFEKPQGETDRYRLSGLFGYVPSEFSAIRLQYNYLGEEVRDEHQVLLQLNYTMGSHPAHNY